MKLEPISRGGQIDQNPKHWYWYQTDTSVIGLILCFYLLSSVCSPLNCFEFWGEIKKYNSNMNYEKCPNLFA